MKTIELTDQEVSAVLFALGGRHHMQLEPHAKVALDEVETKLRATPDVPVTAPVEPVKKAKRGRK